MLRGDVAEFCAAADLLLIRAVPLAEWRSSYRDVPRKVFIDADPLFTQVQLARGKSDLRETVDRCDQLFTIGQRLEKPDCPAPLAGRIWHKTLPPVFLPEWPVAVADGGARYTAILQWRSYREMEYKGVLYGNKNREFPRFLDLPRHTSARLLLALTGNEPGKLSTRGWEVVSGWTVSETANAYRSFIQRSRGEFGVAKHGYVASRCGWFSDRSVCYLASGRPVVVQDTGLGDWMELGQGVLAFDNLDEAASALADVESNYVEHCRAARRIAEDRFDSRRVLSALLEIALS